MTRYVFLLGGIGNVLFQIMKIESVSERSGYRVCNIFSHPWLRKMLHHTNHPQVHRDFLDSEEGGLWALPVLIIDILLARFLRFSLFTVFDINGVSSISKPLLTDWLYLGYFQNDVDVTTIRETTKALKIKSLGSESVVVHIRGGDFINEADKFTSRLEVSYYTKAFAALNDIGINILGSCALVTNDRDYAALVMDDIHSTEYHFVGKSVIEDFRILLGAKVVVCSNSTFAFIASLMNEKIEVLVIPEFFKEKFKNFESMSFKVVFIK